MTDSVRMPGGRLPIRVRLTMWYVLLMGLTFLLVGAYLSVRFQSTLLESVDSGLQLAVASSLAMIDDESRMLAFDQSDYALLTNDEIGKSTIVVRLLSLQGEVLDMLGAPYQVPLWTPSETGFVTQEPENDGAPWRIYSQPVLSQDGVELGWIQAAQSLEAMNKTLDGFRTQLLWLLPVIIILASAGGYFFAGRMLRPIDQITRAADEIEVRDLAWRMSYRGPADEIGRLARTFDRMLERLQVAFESERRFTADAAHELRTPLTALKGQIDVALSRERSLREYQDTLGNLSSYVGQLIRLSNALLFFSLSDQRRLAWEPTEVDLAQSLSVIVEHVQPLTEEKSLKLSAEIAEDLLVVGDTDHLTRLFWNLLDNAVKYTPEGGTITLKATRDRSYVQVAIKNSSLGIAQEHLPFLFDRFYRVDTDRSRATGGSGLGLAIAREIVRLYQGSIEVQSVPGENVLFTVRLPRHPR